MFFRREIYRKSGAESSGQKREGWTVTFIAVKKCALSFPGHSLTSTCHVPTFLLGLSFLQWPSLRKTPHTFRKKKKSCSGNFPSPNLENSNIHLAVHLHTHNLLQFGFCAHSTISGTISAPLVLPKDQQPFPQILVFDTARVSTEDIFLISLFLPS